jgi:hypothetical protein
VSAVRRPLGLVTGRGLGFVAACVGMWVAGRALGVDVLWTAAVALGVVVLTAVVWVATTATRLETARRVVPARLFHGAVATVEVRIRNGGHLPTSLLAARDVVPAGLPADTRFVLPPLRPGGVSRLRYAVPGTRRGVYDIGPTEVQVRDPFGVAARAVRHGGTDRLVVYPPIHRLASGLPLRGLAGSGGSSHPHPGANADEVATVREYVHGDELRKVHWASTAHRGQLMVRQDEAPQRPDAAVVLDLRQGAHVGAGADASLETAASAAASVTYHLAEHGFDAALLTGPVQSQPRPLPWEAALERIAGFGLEPDVDLASLWGQLATGVGHSGLLVAVVCVPDASMLRAMVRAGRGAAVKVALLVDADAHGRGPRRGPEPGPTARALGAAGWRVTVLGPADDIGRRWRELLAGSPGGRVGRP